MPRHDLKEEEVITDQERDDVGLPCEWKTSVVATGLLTENVSELNFTCFYFCTSWPSIPHLLS